jgi:hypothetical protein
MFLSTNNNINCVRWYEKSVLTNKILQYLSLLQLIMHYKCYKNVTEQWYGPKWSQIQCLCPLQKSVPCMKIQAESLGHLKLTIEKAEKHCWDQLNDFSECWLVFIFPLLGQHSDVWGHCSIDISSHWKPTLLVGIKVLQKSSVTFSTFCRLGIVAGHWHRLILYYCSAPGR